MGLEHEAPGPEHEAEPGLRTAGSDRKKPAERSAGEAFLKSSGSPARDTGRGRRTDGLAADRLSLLRAYQGRGCRGNVRAPNSPGGGVSPRGGRGGVSAEDPCGFARQSAQHRQVRIALCQCCGDCQARLQAVFFFLPRPRPECGARARSRQGRMCQAAASFPLPRSLGLAHLSVAGSDGRGSF